MLIWGIITSVLAIIFFAGWVERNNWGRESFNNSPIRDNCLPLWAPFFLFGVWIFTMFVVARALMLITGISDKDDPIINQTSLAVSSVLTSFLSLTLAAAFFNGGLSGFGIDFKTAKRDFKRAFGVLVQSWPAVTAMMICITALVPYLTNGKMNVPSHPMLDYANTASSQLVIVFISIIVVFVAPLLEEILFRGFVQTKVSENIQNRWGAIFMTSVFFAIVHGGTLWMHWPALFLFSCVLGYVYEKSGSLLQSIFLHAMFNGSNLVLSLIGSQFS
ncbi:MAG: lysostaphin resistance A-like protein [Sedimentisphaeraceae bacterium JB056]